MRLRKQNGVEIGRALVTLSSQELSLLCGKRSADFEAALGYAGPGSVAHRTNVVLLAQAS